MKKILVCLLLFLRIPAFTQESSLVFDRVVHSYGILVNTQKVCSKFTFRNLGQNPVKITKVSSCADYQYYTTTPIMPGDTGSVQVHYIPSKSGVFKKKITVSSADAEYVLTINATITALNSKGNEYWFVMNNNSSAVAVMHQLMVLDKKTGMPVEQATVVIGSGNIHQSTLNADDDGRLLQFLSPSLYDFTVSAPDYKKAYKSIYTTVKAELNRDTIYLQPIPKAEIPKDTVKPKPVPVPAPPPPDNVLTDDYKPNNVIFVIDLSGSMQDSTKLPYLKLSMKNMIAGMRPIDQFCIITYSNTASVFVPVTTVDDKAMINKMIDQLQAHGVSFGGKAITLAYEEAVKHYLKDGNNQVIFVTDGQFTLREEDKSKIIAYSNPSSRTRIILTTLAFGNSPFGLSKLKEMSQYGRGSFIHIVSRESALSALIDEIKKNSKKK